MHASRVELQQGSRIKRDDNSPGRWASIERSFGLQIERSVTRFLKIPKVVAALSAKRNTAIKQMEKHSLKDALAEWNFQLEVGAVSRPSTTGSKWHWGKLGMEFRAALHKFKDEFNRP